MLTIDKYDYNLATIGYIYNEESTVHVLFLDGDRISFDLREQTNSTLECLAREFDILW